MAIIDDVQIIRGYVRSSRSGAGAIGAILVASLAGCTSAPLGELGTFCNDGTWCESGVCDPVELFCTSVCSAGEACPDPLVCGPAGLCQIPCNEGSTSGTGADRAICIDGLYQACSERDPVADCDACGCEPFGGGSCVDGRGCVVPQPDGSPCTMDAECAPHACLRDTGTCGPPRAMGELCSVDAECATHNCSTDGDETQTGVCNQELGTVCSSTGMTATCTNCFYWDLTFDPVCARAFCDPIDAPCPQLGEPRRVWSCELSTDGQHRCYEHCDDFDYDCFDSRSFCNNGYCS